ncbi:hypothetical protein FQA39_LY08611 [Lamprigera yunnana]|nr:hypothetical protein FQA39_LY08611 [Lamprigera yunnana]
MDTIWETYPHRLNEAGLNRYADTSVLTEDTDSFIIGEKVWVAGTKPGQIAYIGETQFAPGEWAGIVLDSPIGKNDGSVGGTRYFQCEPKRGVFSRLTRLMRTPLPGVDESFLTTPQAHSVTSTPFHNGTRARATSPLSPPASINNLRKSPSLSTSNTSLASVTHVVDFKVGDRVIIKSSQGSKVGTLRYLGTTSFACGEWCGVELDDPRGKNDGSVEGIRYFQCVPQFGLFAPVTKVSKSPLKYKPGNCVLHSGAKLSSSGLKRMGSKESMTSFTSMASSMASTTSGARRDVLREKQSQIEQLLKERSLERAEFTRAANQADNAEQQLATLQTDYERYRSDCESKLKEYSTVLSHLNLDRDTLLSQLDDEKRKNEDLQFKFEEAAISKGDIEANNRTNIQQIRDLEERLALERQKVEFLEQESGKLFEAEEALVKSREEIDTLKLDLQRVRKKHDSVQQENSVLNESSAVIQHQVESSKIQRDIYKAESYEKKEELKVGLLSSQSTKINLSTQTEKSEEHFQTLKKYEEEISALKLELSKTKTFLHEKTTSMENELKHKVELEFGLRTELDYLKAELLQKSTEIDGKDVDLKMKGDEIRSLKALLETSEIDLKAKIVDMERSKQDFEDSYNIEIGHLKEMLKKNVMEREEVEKAYIIQVAQQKSKLEDASNVITQNMQEIEKLQINLKETKINIERNSIDVHERHTRQIAIRESELMALAAELQQKNEEVSQCSIVTTKLEDDICIKNGMIEKLKLELESYKKHSEAEELSMLNYTERISTLQLTIGDLQGKLAGTEQLVLELKEQKARLEAELQNVIAASGDYSVELQKLNAAVLEKEQKITTVRNEFLEKLQVEQSIKQQLQLQLQKEKEDFERISFNLEEKLKTAHESEEILQQCYESGNMEAIKVRDELMLKVNQLQRSVEEKDFALKVAIGDHNENKLYLKEQLDRTTSELQKIIDTCQFKINELSVEGINSKTALAQKTQELIESEANLKNFIAQSQSNEEEIQKSAEEQIKKLQFELSEKSAQVQQFLTELKLLKHDCQTRYIDIAEKDHCISELSVQLESTLKLVNQLQVDKDGLQLSQMEANKQCTMRNEQCIDLTNQVAILSEKAELGDKAAQELLLQKTVHQQLLQQLQVTEQQKQDLIMRLETEIEKNGEVEKCYYALELAKKIQTTTNNEHTKKMLELQQALELAQLKLQENEKQLTIQKEETLALQNELLTAQEICESNHRMPDKQLATEAQASGPALREISTTRNIGMSKAQSTEEQLLAEGQINFLNSIIIDMQRKNQEQKARIQLLESGFSPAAAEELKLYATPGSSERQKPPRVYCDICEMFDDHETEDCPLQDADAESLHLSVSYSKNKRSTAVTRSYCEICEIFGHCTEDCKEDQTF